jgi:hypothetical protein
MSNLILHFEYELDTTSQAFTKTVVLHRKLQTTFMLLDQITILIYFTIRTML